MATTFQVAKRICELGGWDVSNLKLQKLTYLAYLVFLGRHNGTLIEDDIFEAWDYGPVLPRLYKHVKFFGNQPIKDVFQDAPALKPEEELVVSQICEWFMKKTPSELVAMTHRKEGAWAKNYIPKAGNQIGDDDIRAEYRGLVQNQ